MLVNPRCKAIAWLADVHIKDCIDLAAQREVAQDFVSQNITVPGMRVTAHPVLPAAGRWGR